MIVRGETALTPSVESMRWVECPDHLGARAKRISFGVACGLNRATPGYWPSFALSLSLKANRHVGLVALVVFVLKIKKLTFVPPPDEGKDHREATATEVSTSPIQNRET